MSGAVRQGPQPAAWFDRLYARGAVRKVLWKYWYPFLTWQLGRERVTFLNYAFESDPPMGLRLEDADEPDRACIQLYHRAGTQVNLKGRDVLEISCGHGGGAAYLARTQSPRSYTGLDLNPRGIRFCRRQHRENGLNFVCGDAEDLPFADGSFDVVLNVEASHCYGDFPRFLAEVARVLRPGGFFLYSDFRESRSLSSWDDSLFLAGFSQVVFSDVSGDVLRGMEMNSCRSTEIVRRLVPPGFRSLARDFAGVEGSRMHRALRDGTLVYRMGCFLIRREPVPRAGEWARGPGEKHLPSPPD